MRFSSLLGNRNSSGDPEEFRATLAEHLEELRQRLFRIVALLAVGLTIGWFVEPWVYNTLSELARQNIPKGIEYKETFHHITEPFFLKFKMSFYVGLLLTLPFCLYQVWGFVAPGLKPSERKPIRIIAPISVLFFVGGAASCWFILPAGFQWFLEFVKEFPGVALYQEPGTMVFFIVKMLLAFGVGFQLPLVVFFLGKVGILTPESVLRYWRQYVVGIAVFAAVITPSGDWFTMAAMAVPLVLLFFASVFAVKMTNRRVARDAELDDLD